MWSAIVLAFALAGCRVQTGDTEPASSPSGVAAPAATVESVVQAFDLASYEGKVVVLDFWATWSEPSRSQVPAMNAIQNDFADRGVAVVGLAMDKGAPEGVASAAQELGIRYAVQQATEREQSQFGVRAIPTKVLIDRKGQVRKTYAGVVQPEELRAQIIAMMAE
jgi:thiol-disulfide isomerase/thioredoxin